MDSNLEIIIDTREKTPWDFDEFDTTIRKLDTGDYSISGFEDKICIERKSSLGEFYGNITQKRFWNEVERIAEFPHKFLIFEFSLENISVFPYGSGIPLRAQKKLKVSPNFIFSCVTRLQIDYDIHVIFAENRVQAKIIAGKILKKVYKKFG